MIKTNKNGFYYSVQSTYKRFGDFESPNYILSNTGVKEQNASFRFGLNRFKYGLELYYSIFNNELGILRASHLGGETGLLKQFKDNHHGASDGLLC